MGSLLGGAPLFFGMAARAPFLPSPLPQPLPQASPSLRGPKKRADGRDGRLFPHLIIRLTVLTGNEAVEVQNGEVSSPFPGLSLT